MKLSALALSLSLLVMAQAAHAAPDFAQVKEILTKHIKGGRSGVYGPIPMPPNVAVSDADVKTVVEWLVAGAPH
ncbi:MAG: hypothetical protein J0I30_12260 [Burkholderiales bacterium]|nr:hypothetical protein [Burkholderiales bacterium]